MKIIELTRFHSERSLINLKIDRNKNLNNNNDQFKTILFEFGITNIGDYNNQFKATFEDGNISDLIHKVSYDYDFSSKKISNYKELLINSGWPERWHADIIKNIIIAEYIKENSIDDYDFYIFSDTDEVLDHSIFNFLSDKVNFNNRIGQKWLILSPYFEYKILWPGPRIFSNNIFKNLSPLEIALNFQIRNFCLGVCGHHMTYFGKKDIFKKKIKLAPEQNDKRVILAKYFGYYLTRLGLDPFFRPPYKLNLKKDFPDYELEKYFEFNLIKPFIN